VNYLRYVQDSHIKESHSQDDEIGGIMGLLRSNSARSSISGTDRLMARRRVRVRLLLYPLVPALAIAAVGCVIRQPVLRGAERSATQVDPLALAAHVKTLSVDFAPRSCLDTTNLAACADYIAGNLTALGARVTRQPYAAGQRTYQNITGSFGPETGPRLIVGAHYDSCDDTPGADDNASGVAGLLELARLLGNTPLRMTVELVAFSTEEPPYFATPSMGSFHHAASLKQAGVEVAGMICLEMIGYFDDKPWSQRYPFGLFHLLFPSHGNFIAVIGSNQQRPFLKRVKRAMLGSVPLDVVSAAVPAFVQGVDFSDHRNYWAHGYNAVMITDTAFLRNTAYHTPQDTWERLDYDRMAQVVVAVFEAVREQAGMTIRPTDK
jgi:hypothetical protein